MRNEKSFQTSLLQQCLIHTVCQVSRPMILVVREDDSSCAQVARYLQRQGFRTSVVHDGMDALASIHDSPPDLVLLSLLLRDLSGLEVCCRIRRRSAVPVVMLAGTDSVSEPEVGLALGADDYVVWPTRRREMIARLRAVLRRANGHCAAIAHEPIEIGGLSLDPGGYEARFGGQRLELSPREFELLELLVENASRTIPKRSLALRLWGPEYDVGSRRLEASITRLRSKLARADATESRIVTVRGIGYAYRPESGRGRRAPASPHHLVDD
jgi:DNA-binding response OmpR family regulator